MCSCLVMALYGVSSWSLCERGTRIGEEVTAVGDAEIVLLRALESCMAMSTSIARCRSLTSGSLGLKDRVSVGESRARGIRSSSPVLFRCLTGECECSELPRIVLGELEIVPERIEELSGGDAMTEILWQLESVNERGLLSLQQRSRVLEIAPSSLGFHRCMVT